MDVESNTGGVTVLLAPPGSGRSTNAPSTTTTRWGETRAHAGQVRASRAVST